MPAQSPADPPTKPRVIALMNQKGGVGKTTTTVNLGAALAEAGKRVCLIDLDPQAHLTINYGIEPDGGRSAGASEGAAAPDAAGDEGTVGVYDLLVEGTPFLQAIHKLPAGGSGGRVAIVAGTIDLAGAEAALAGTAGRQTVLRQRIKAAEHDFDYILLDCPPSLGLLTVNALAAADEVLVPMQPQFLALQGFAKLLETVKLVAERLNPALTVAGVVLTMYDSQTKLTGEVEAELQRFMSDAAGKTMADGRPLPWSGAKVFETRVRRNIKLAECPSFGEHILTYDANSNGAADYRALAAELTGVPATDRVSQTRAAATPRPRAAGASGAANAPKATVSRTLDPTKLKAARAAAKAAPPVAVAPDVATRHEHVRAGR